MPTFIKRKIIKQDDGEGGAISRPAPFNDAELMHLLDTEPSRFFEVSESHAHGVLRKSPHYQEVSEDVLNAHRAAELAEADAGPDVRPVLEDAGVPEGEDAAGLVEGRAGSTGTVPTGHLGEVGLVDSDDGDGVGSEGGASTYQAGARVQPPEKGNVPSQPDAAQSRGASDNGTARAPANQHRRGKARRGNSGSKGGAA